jgi:hypothetical protein
MLSLGLIHNLCNTRTTRTLDDVLLSVILLTIISCCFTSELHFIFKPWKCLLFEIQHRVFITPHCKHLTGSLVHLGHRPILVTSLHPPT